MYFDSPIHNCEVYAAGLASCWIIGTVLTLSRIWSRHIRFFLAYGKAFDWYNLKPEHHDKTKSKTNMEEIHRFFRNKSFQIFSLSRTMTFQLFYLTGSVLTLFFCLLCLTLDPEGHGTILVGQGLRLTLLLTHCLRRLIETTYVQKTVFQERMHVFQLLCGCFFYLLVPSSYFFPIYCAAGGQDTRKKTHLVSFQWSFLSLCVISEILQCCIHVSLACLRSYPQNEVKRKRRRKQRYTLPHFPLLLCPHYTAEILFYSSLCGVNKDFHWLYLSIPLFTLLNLAITSDEQYRWYTHFFPGQHPRWRILPFLF